jgi:parallel beta-helix repeat protein
MSKSRTVSRRALGKRLDFDHLERRAVLSLLFVSPSGNDAAIGSDLAPLKTLQRAADVAKAGDTVTVRAGNYAGFNLTSDGAATAPISFRADPGVTVNARNLATPDGINLEGADYVTIEGFKVVGMPRAGIRSVSNSHVTIRNNVVDQNATWGIFTGFSEDLLVEGNTTSRSQTQHGIYVSNSGDRPIIRNNVSWGNYGAGIHMNGDASQGGDGIISGGLVEGNTIYGNGIGGGSGINCDGVQGSRIQNNLIYDTHASGISLFRQDGGGASSNNVVANNTVLVAADGRWALNIQNASTGNTVINNILYNSGTFRGSLDISPDSLSGLTSDYNAVMDRFTTDGGGSRLTLTQWRSTTGQDAHSIIASPSQLFVAPSTNDYHLSSTSLAIDAGTSLNAPANDRDGVARPTGNGWDIGAYEYLSSTQATNRVPIATSDTVTTSAKSSVRVAVLANDSDPDGDSLTITSVTQGAGGKVTINTDGTITYTPTTNFVGSDSFSYTINDGHGGTATATVKVTVKRR